MSRSHVTGLGIALAPLLTLLVLVGLSTNWQFVYTLDDPYIHLALAKGISRLHYGINSSEFSAPSSSILWPFLMAPFAHLWGFRLVPLVLNCAFLLGTLVVLRRLLSSRFGVGRFPSWVLASLVAFFLNIYGLVFTGMEHSLQVFLVALIASAVAQRYLGTWLWTSLLVLPLVRYEGLAISLPVLCYMAFQGRTAKASAIVTGLVLAIGLVSFSSFLAGLGLGYLPSSVFAKQSATTAGSAFGLFKAMARGALENAFSTPTLIVCLLSLLAGLAAWTASRSRVLLLLSAPAVLHLCMGRNGWFGRYEVSILLYLLIVSADLVVDRVHLRTHSLADQSLRLQTGLALPFEALKLYPLLLILVVGTGTLWRSTLLTPLAAKNIYDQQIQMATIVGKYLDEPVAVNDLGAVALGSRKYVLDLWGLGSYEALSLRKDPAKDPRAWIQRLMSEKHVSHAFVYDAWFPEAPDNWIRVANLNLPGTRVTPASDVVALYSTSPDSADKLAEAIARFKSENPDKASMIKLFRRKSR